MQQGRNIGNLYNQLGTRAISRLQTPRDITFIRNSIITAIDQRNYQNFVLNVADVVECYKDSLKKTYN